MVKFKQMRADSGMPIIKREGLGLFFTRLEKIGPFLKKKEKGSQSKYTIVIL